MINRPKPVLTLACLLFATCAAAQPRNRDESKVAPYNLPSPLVATDGTTITTPQEWEQRRRPELLKLFAQHIYGETPESPALKQEVLDVQTSALDGLATRKQVRLTLPDHPEWEGIDLILYVPKAATRPVPVFVGLSFVGNQGNTMEMDLPITTRWMRESTGTVVNNRAIPESRGIHASRWPLQQVLLSGYAVAIAYYGDIEPDHADGWENGVRAALSPAGKSTQWKPHDWAAIGAWAWGLSRMLDYCETDHLVDAKRAIVIGHSRLGKTALWAGAQDQRFAAVISNNSGEGGAALARRTYGETAKVLANVRPYWFCKKYQEYQDNVEAMPVDQHMLIALMAPRPVYIASATEDWNADPLGEFLAGVHAGPVYQLYGLEGTGTSSWPPPNTPVGSHISYHCREGKHDITSYDWEQYVRFADRHFKSHGTPCPPGSPAAFSAASRHNNPLKTREQGRQSEGVCSTLQQM